MKLSSLSLFIAGFLFISPKAFSQDISMNILQQPAFMNTNSTGAIQIVISNEPSTSLSLPSYKICPLISVPNFVTITGVTDLPAGWSICSNDGHNIRLSNGTGTIAPLDAVTFYINLASSSATSAATTISATLGFDGGTAATACTNFGAQTIGNQVGNDNSTTSVGVVNGTMPVKKIDLSAVLNNNIAAVKWITLDEQQVSRFELERSIDGSNFAVVSSKKAVGNSMGETTYNYADDISALTAPLIYYRVKGIDINGPYYYSSIVMVKVTKGNSIAVWPNPFTEQANIKVNAIAKGKATVNLYSSTGMLVKKMEAPVSSGTNFITLAGLGQLPHQIYIIDVMIDNENVYRGKLIK